MARKKSNTKLVALGGLSTVVIIGLVGVFILYPNILKEDVITTTTVEEIIEEGIEQGVLTIPIPCFEITSCDEGQPIISEEVESNPIEEVIDPTPTIDDPIEPELESIIIDEEEVVVDPITIEPIIEELPPEPPIVEIVSNVTKISNTGERFTSSTSFNVPLRLELFVEDTTNIDFDQGFIENQLFLKTDPNSNVEVNGFLDILIENMTVLSNPVSINVQGTTDQDGMILINFLSPTGIQSDIFLFQFTDHTDKFPAQGMTKIEYKLSGVTININEFGYALDFETIFEMDIFTDPNLILITNEQGGLLRVFPTDDNVKLCSNVGKLCYKQCTVNSVRFGCQKYRTVCQSVSAPQIGAWNFFKQDKNSGIFVAVNSGTSFSASCPLNENVQRDEVYKLQIFDPNKATITWKTEPEQRNFLFSCTTIQSATTGLKTPSCNYNNDAFLGGLLPP